MSQHFKISSGSSARWQLFAVTWFMQHISFSYLRIKGILPEGSHSDKQERFLLQSHLWKWKTHLGSSRTRSYWLNFENKELKNTKLAALLGVPLLWRHCFSFGCKKLTKKQPEAKYILKIMWYINNIGHG